MQISLNRYTAVLIIVTLFQVNCATFRKDKSGKVLTDQPLEFKYAMANGREEIMKYYSIAEITDFENSKVKSQKNEVVDFKVQSVVRARDPVSQLSLVRVTTIDKDGPVDLKDLAFPELLESIDYIFNDAGQVIRAGQYPQSSIFFVPPLSLPKKQVKVGDTWEMDHTWLSLKNNIPINLQMVTIFKNLYACGDKDLCADLEVSGQAKILGVEKKGFSFNSDIRGRLLFSLKNGLVVWSLVKSDETMEYQNKKTTVKSCLLGQLMEPVEDQWKPGSIKTTCEAKDIYSIDLPVKIQ